MFEQFFDLKRKCDIKISLFDQTEKECNQLSLQLEDLISKSNHEINIMKDWESRKWFYRVLFWYRWINALKFLSIYNNMASEILPLLTIGNQELTRLYNDIHNIVEQMKQSIN